MAYFCSEIVTELALSFFEESLNEISSSKRSLISRAYKITSFNRSNMPANWKMESSEGSWNMGDGRDLNGEEFHFCCLHRCCTSMCTMALVIDFQAVPALG